MVINILVSWIYIISSFIHIHSVHPCNVIHTVLYCKFQLNYFTFHLITYEKCNYIIAQPSDIIASFSFTVSSFPQWPHKGSIFSFKMMIHKVIKSHFSYYICFLADFLFVNKKNNIIHNHKTLKRLMWCWPLTCVCLWTAVGPYLPGQCLFSAWRRCSWIPRGHYSGVYSSSACWDMITTSDYT